MVIKQVINSCILKSDPVLLALHTLIGFPYLEKCSSVPGKFCIENKKIVKIPISTQRILDMSEFGNMKVRVETKYDGNRTSCIIADLIITHL